MKTEYPMTKSPRAVAREALRLATDALPAYSSKYSRKDFTQHQLFAVLALKTFLKTDYRGVAQFLADFAETGAAVVNDVTGGTVSHVGYDLTTHTSKGLTDFNGREVDVAVTMGCGDECPLVLARRREDWQIPDPRDMTPDEFRGVRNLIEAKVKELLATL